MISATFVCSPHTLHTAWKGTACCDDGCIFVDSSVDRCKCCCLCDLSVCKFYIFRDCTRIFALISGSKSSPVYSMLPRRSISLSMQLLLSRSHLYMQIYILLHEAFLLKCFTGSFCIAHTAFTASILYAWNLQLLMLTKLNILILEQMLGACCKVRHSGTDRNYHVCVFQ